MKRRIDELEDARREKVEEILHRYGLQLVDREKYIEEKRYEQMMDELSIPERKLVLGYLLEPSEALNKRISVFFDFLAPLIVQVYIEHNVWHKLINIDTPLDDSMKHFSEHDCFDMDWIQARDPDLWKRFVDELKKSPEPGKPGFDDWVVSKEVSDQFKKYYADILEVKKRIRQEHIDAAIKDVLELREIPGCEEDAAAEEEDLRRCGITVPAKGCGTMKEVECG